MAITEETCRKAFAGAFVYHMCTMVVLLVTLILTLWKLLPSSVSMCEYDAAVILLAKVVPGWLLSIQMMAAQEDPSKLVHDRQEKYPIDMFSKSFFPALGIWLNTAFAIWAYLLAKRIDSEMTLSNIPGCKVSTSFWVTVWVGSLANGLLLLTQLVVYLPSAISVVYTRAAAYYRANRPQTPEWRKEPFVTK